MPLDYRTAIVNQAWALLEANSDFNDDALGFRSGNRLKQDAKTPIQKTQAGTPGGPFPRISIELTDDFQPQQTQITFGQPGNVDFTVPVTVKILVRMTFDTRTLAVQSQETLVQSIFMTTWPNFGIGYCIGFTEISGTRRMEKGDPNNIERLVVKKTIAFYLRPLMSQLTQ